MANEILHVTATPSSFTSGNFPLSTLQSGPAYHFTITPSLISSNTAYNGDVALLATNDNGGLYLENRQVSLFNGSGAGTLVAQSTALTWSASTVISITIRIAAGANASSITVAGATTGNGTTTFTTSGTYFTATTLGVGQFTNSNTFTFTGTISSIDDAAAASASGTAAVAGITSTGTTIPGTFATGTSAAAGITSTGVAASPGSASGSSAVAGITSSGTAIPGTLASGTAAVGGITSSGITSGPALASGSAQVGGVSSSGSASASLFGTIGASSAGQRADQTGPSTGSFSTAFVARTPSAAVAINDRLAFNGRRWHVNAAGTLSSGAGPSSAGVQADGSATLVALTSTNQALTMTTQPSSSVMVAFLMRENWNAQSAAPTDNKGNTYALKGSVHFYADFPSAASAIYAATNLAGGAGHVVSAQYAAKSSTGAEGSMLVVEVPTGRATAFVQAVAFVETVSTGTVTSPSVTTTGPAMLVAFWGGTGGVITIGTAHPGASQTPLTQLLDADTAVAIHVNGYVQGKAAFAFKADPGTYTAIWTGTAEGAQLYLVAIQEAPGTVASGTAAVGGITGSGVAGPSAAGTSQIGGVTTTGAAALASFGAAAVAGISSSGSAGTGTAAAGTAAVAGITSTGATIPGTFASGTADVAGISSSGDAASTSPSAASGSSQVGGVTSSGTSIPGTFASGTAVVGGVTSTGSASGTFTGGSAAVGGIGSVGIAVSSSEAAGPALVLRASLAVVNALFGTLSQLGATVIEIIGPVSVYQGDTLDLVLSVSDDAGLPIDLTTAAIELQVKEAAGAPDPALIAKSVGSGIVLLDQVTDKGKALCSFSSVDTARAAQTYAMDVVVQIGVRRQHVVAPRPFAVLPVVNAP